MRHLSTIIAQPSLRHLEFLTSSFCDLIDQFDWPVQCKLQHLAMQSYAKERVVDGSGWKELIKKKLSFFLKKLEIFHFLSLLITISAQWNDFIGI